LAPGLRGLASPGALEHSEQNIFGSPSLRACMPSLADIPEAMLKRAGTKR
jgi:hypothetical protein